MEKIGEIKTIKVLQDGVKIAGKAIPQGTVFSVMETYDENDLAICVLSSETWKQDFSLALRRIEIIIYHEIGSIKIFDKEKSKLPNTPESTGNFADVNEIPGLNNMFSLPGEKAFF